MENRRFIGRRVAAHDRHNVEIKLLYPVRPSDRFSEYSVDTYFFIPKSLGLNALTFPTSRFYSNLQGYIRFTTPNITLRELGGSSPDNIMIRIERVLAQHDPENTKEVDSVVADFRLVGCVVRAQLRDFVGRFRKRVASKTSEENIPKRIKSLQHVLSDLDTILLRVRTWSSRCTHEELEQAFNHLDEFLSMTVENHLTEVLALIDERSGHQDAHAEVRAQLVNRLRQEIDHQGAHSSAAATRLRGKRERYLQKRSKLKKFIMSILFLKLVREKEGKRLGDLFAALAAGLAMLVSTLALLYSTENVGIKINSMPFVGAAVFIYIVKDRVKEGSKRYFSSRLSNWLSDYTIKIVDPSSGQILGRCRESVDYVRRGALPEAVFAIRHGKSDHTYRLNSRPENIVRYQKSVKLNAQKVRSKISGIDGVNDIIRFNFADFLSRADDSKRSVKKYDPILDTVSSTKLNKVYHINLIMLIRSHKSGLPLTTERVRVVLNKKKIIRVENLGHT